MEIIYMEMYTHINIRIHMYVQDAYTFIDKYMKSNGAFCLTNYISKFSLMRFYS